MKNTLALIHTPLQLINAIEATLFFEKDTFYLCFSRNPENTKILKNIFELFEIKSFQIIKINSFFKLTYLFSLIKKIEKITIKPSCIIHGNYTGWTSHIINSTSPNELIHVDDGFKTTKILTRPHEVGVFKKSILKTLSKEYMQRTHFFTYYSQLANSNGKLSTQNYLSYIQNHLKTFDLEFLNISEQIYPIFIGTNILKLCYSIEDIFAFLSTRLGKNFLYIMHRYDDPVLVNKLAKKYDFTAVKFSLPIELVFKILWDKNKPSVWSLGTSAIDTLQLINSDLYVNILQIDIANFKNNYLQSYHRSLYSTFTNNSRIFLHKLNEIHE